MAEEDPGQARSRPSVAEEGRDDRESLVKLVELHELVKTLRSRCPWDRRQTHASLAPHLMEEACEALDAIEDLAAAEPAVPPAVVEHLEEELGDVLFQVLFHSVLAEEEERFTIEDVARSLHDKLVRRHPHVFGDAVADTAEEVAARWELLKGVEKGRKGVTSGVPESLPSLALASKLLRKAETLGIELPTSAERRLEISSHLGELSSAACGAEGPSSAEGASTAEVPSPPAGPASRQGPSPEVSGRPETEPEISRLFGLVLLCVADLARRAGVDPEIALRSEARRLRLDLENRAVAGTAD